MSKTVITTVCLLALTTLALAANPTPLNQRDAKAAPQWVQRGVMYQIQPRAFTPEGTLNAAAARLKNLAELGVDIIYLCPVFVADDDMDRDGWSPRQKRSGMNNPRNPYRMKDYYHVDPEYGTDADLKAFVNEAHKQGLRVLLDMVYLHCGPNAVFIKDHPNFVKRDKDGNILTTKWNFPYTNIANPEFREYLYKNMEYWVRDFDVDGFRCDVSDAVSLDFWLTARRRLEKLRPDIGMLAEGQRREDQLEAFDMNYSFTWFNAVRGTMEQGKPASHIRDVWQKMADERPRGARLIRYIDNHDISNDSYDHRIEERWSTPRVNAALVMLFTIDGVPMLYNGQEVIDHARHSIYARLPVDWAHGNTPAGKARFEFCQKLCAMRHEQIALTEGSVQWLDNDQPEAVLSYLRRKGDQQVLTVINVKDQTVEVRVPLPGDHATKFDTLLSHGVKMTTNKDAVLTLEPFGYYVGKQR
ncbi:hypothetical protein HED60_06365 [Planctomycetales bacterium ZRK34]|nr:hypothetical protein HED60_06365 [Planctomycetales bacterium ZRK34]